MLLLPMLLPMMIIINNDDDEDDYQATTIKGSITGFTDSISIIIIIISESSDCNGFW